eukprot:120158-Prymnesium_polylepis.1
MCKKATTDWLYHLCEAAAAGPEAAISFSFFADFGQLLHSRFFPDLGQPSPTNLPTHAAHAHRNMISPVPSLLVPDTPFAGPRWSGFGTGAG